MKTIIANFKNKVINNPYLFKISSNISWLILDKFFRMGLGLFVTAWITRYLGPEKFGLLSYMLALMSFFITFIIFGLNSITVKNLVNDRENKNQILGSCFLIQSISSSLAFLALIIIITFVFEDKTSQLVLFIIGLSICCKPFDTIRYYFEANTQSKYIVIADNLAFIICSILKILLILFNASFISIVWIFLLETIISTILLIVLYTYKGQNIFNWKFKLSQIQQDVKSCWPLLFASITIIIYMRIDQIMLGQLLDYSMVGIYTAATRISEIWYFIPLVIVASVNPTLMEIRLHNQDNYYKKLKLIMITLVIISLLIAIMVTFTANYIIYILYGEEYKEAAKVLIIHIWTGVFVSLGVVSGQWFIVENLQILFMYRSLTGAIVNVIMNLLLIPSFGLLGAAIATLIGQISATFLFDLFNKRTRPIFWLKLESLNVFSSTKILIKGIKNL